MVRGCLFDEVHITAGSRRILGLPGRRNSWAMLLRQVFVGSALGIAGGYCGRRVASARDIGRGDFREVARAQMTSYRTR